MTTVGLISGVVMREASGVQTPIEDKKFPTTKIIASTLLRRVNLSVFQLYHFSVIRFCMYFLP